MSLHFELRRQKAGQSDPYNDYDAEKAGQSHPYNDYDADYYPIWSRNKASNEESAKSNFYRGLAHERRGDTRKAIDAFTKAINYDPLYGEAWFYRGKAYDRIEKIEESINDYSQAIRLSPQNPKALFYRGKAYHKLDNLNQTIADYSQAITYNSEYAEAYGNRGYALTKLYKKNNHSSRYQLERGIDDLQKAANLFKKQGNIVSYDKAIRLLEPYL